MLKKVIISICTTIVLSIVGVASVVDVENKEVKSDTENQITLNETNEITDVALTETETSNEVEEVVQENIEKSQNSNNENTLKQENTNTGGTKTNNSNQSNQNKGKNEELEKSTNEDSTKEKPNNNKQEDNQTITSNQETTNKKEEISIPKEKITYNDTATQKLIQDIDDIAKRNKDLWGENSEKRYKIQISSNLLGGNYMCPYRKAQVEGIVLNSYPVTFLVYAVTYQKTGFQDEVRYYISVTNY